MCRVKFIREPKEPNDVYIGRGSKWGNPYRIGVHGSRDAVIAKYRDYLESNEHLKRALPELRGKNLVCYCKPKACHGDVLMEYLATDS
tara:strand:+ start:922 stop:1185 length:264 start_codon:yes stop_codon:yes gene_type:complete